MAIAASRTSLRFSCAGKGAVVERGLVRILPASVDVFSAMWAGVVALGIEDFSLELPFDVAGVALVLVSFGADSKAVSSSSHAANFSPEGGKDFTGLP